MNFKNVISAIPYLQGKDLSRHFALFDRKFKDRIFKNSANLMYNLSGWNKPFFLLFDALALPKLPGCSLLYQSYTFAAQSLDGKCFQVCYLKVAVPTNSDEVYKMIEFVLKQLRTCGLIHLLLALVCDNGPLNSLAIHNTENKPVLWDFRHIQDSISLDDGEHFVLNDLYTLYYFKRSTDLEIAKMLNINSRVNNTLVAPVVKRQIEIMHGVISYFFSIEPLADHFQPAYCKNDKLAEMGKRWKKGLQRALDSLDSSQLIDEAQNWLTDTLIILALKEAKRFNFDDLV